MKFFRLGLITLLLISVSCLDSSHEKLEFGHAVISNQRQDIKARMHYYFKCDKRIEEEPFGTFTQLEMDNSMLRITNIENGGFEGRTIKFIIDDSLKILDSNYNEWYDVIYDNRTENYEVIECGINLNQNPFQSSGQELIGDYFVKVKHTTDFKWSWKEKVEFFVITGRFKCDKNVW
ncbi:hypothetical protein [Croceivirga radicis]|uniref:hypothetical protein n=1 Tax=Croceivirga radicis TaxID=1929488 RepID=UPI000255B559|nr:hypothetical protein [Croceivirga radicis]